MTFHFSPVEHLRRSTKLIPKVVKLLFSLSSSWKMTPANMFIPITAKIKNISIINEPTLPIDGRMTIKLSISTLRFLEALTNLNNLMILIDLMMTSALTKPPSSLVAYSAIKLASATTTMKKSNLFQLLLKYSYCRAMNLIKASKL